MCLSLSVPARRRRSTSQTSCPWAQVSINRPVAIDTIVVSTQHNEEVIDSKTGDMSDAARRVVRAAKAVA